VFFYFSVYLSYWNFCLDTGIIWIFHLFFDESFETMREHYLSAAKKKRLLVAAFVNKKNIEKNQEKTIQWKDRTSRAIDFEHFIISHPQKATPTKKNRLVPDTILCYCNKFKIKKKKQRLFAMASARYCCLTGLAASVTSVSHKISHYY